MIKNFLKKVGLLSKKGEQTPLAIPRAEHGLSRQQISENALKVLYRLNRQGYEAYLVGGGVRDVLMSAKPKDFDVVTNAKPEEIRQVFKNCRLIGRRFRLAHVYFGRDIVEVATFRGQSDQGHAFPTHSDKGMILHDNVYGTMQEDVWRRDFTINALYYNIKDFSLVDYVGGYADLKAKRLRMIGDVGQRYQEDPVRMLRAIRFASKLDFSLSTELTKPMMKLKGLLLHVPPARMFEEIVKMFHSGAAVASYQLLKKHGLFALLFSETDALLNDSSLPVDALLTAVFANTDMRIQNHQHVTPMFILVALLWFPIEQQAAQYEKEGMPFGIAHTKAMDKVLKAQLKQLSVPKRLTQGARDIWQLQWRFNIRHPKRVWRILQEERLRGAVDFLEMRVKVGHADPALAKWWRTLIEADEPAQAKIIQKLKQKTKKRRPRKIKKEVQS